MKKPIIILIALLIVARVLYGYLTHKTLTADYPISSIDFNPSSIIIHVHKQATMAEVINMGLFAGINPKMTEDGVIKRLGKPKDSSNKQGYECLIYYTNDGRIEFGNDSGTLADNSSYDTNVVTFYRENIPRKLVFKGRTGSYLPKDLDGFQVAVVKNDTSSLTINFSREDEDWIQWSHEISYHPPSE